MTISVKWIDRFREPKQPPNPKYPNGIDVDLAKAANKTCKAELPYPARRCGYFFVHCETCGYTALITTAGRPDDPKTVRLPCKLN
jgi:hypothetical protein